MRKNLKRFSPKIDNRYKSKTRAALKTSRVFDLYLLSTQFREKSSLRDFSHKRDTRNFPAPWFSTCLRRTNSAHFRPFKIDDSETLTSPCGQTLRPFLIGAKRTYRLLPDQITGALFGYSRLTAKSIHRTTVWCAWNRYESFLWLFIEASHSR